MRAHANLSFIIILSVWVTVGFAQDAVTTPLGDAAADNTGTEALEVPTFPYFAEITGNDVQIRSGPGRNFYACGELFTADKIEVVGSQFTWSKIEPPAGSFSWIPMQYVDIDSEDPSFGIVTGDDVRVYAGSDNVRPAYSTSLQVKLNNGDRVRLLNEQLDDYYKISPPSGAYLWVSTQYTKPIVASIESAPTIAYAPSEDASTNTDVMADMEEVAEEPDDTVPETVVEIIEPTPREKYEALKVQLEAERAKSLNLQDYSSIKEGLSAIADDEEADKVARYAQATIEQIEGFELALEVNETVKLQNEQLRSTMERIDKARITRLAEIEDLGRYAVVGKLQTFITYGPGHYRILDKSDKTICTASPSKQASGKDFSALLGKRVGLVGMIEPNNRLAGALVRFDEIVALE